MRLLLGMMLLAGAAGAQTGTTPGLGRRPTPPPAAGRGRVSAPATGATSGVNSPKELKYPPLRPIQAPDFAAFTLSNGMKLCLLEDHDLPVVGGVALVRTGNLQDPPQRIGLAQLVGITMRTGGTTVKTGEQIDTLLDNLASTTESSIGDTQGTLSFAALKENAPATLQLFKEILTQPGFRPDKVEVAKTQLRVNIAHRNDNAAAIARREFAGLIYGKDAPIGWQPEYATIDRISRNDLRAFHQKYFFPANVTLGLWGDFNTAEMRAAVEVLFADWTVRQPPVAAFATVKTAVSPGVFLVEKKDASQASFTIGQVGGRRDDKDFAALETLSGILGSGSRSRLASHLRTKLGIANDITAAWNAGFVEPGVFEISGSAATFSTVAAIKAIQEEIEGVRTSEVTEEELKGAREITLNRLVFAEDSRAKLFVRQMILDYYGYPKNYLQQYQKALESVTRADVLRVAKQYLNPANLTMVVAANPAMLGEPLEKLGPVTKLNIAIPESKAVTVESTEASLAEGKQILLKAQAAVGGAEKLATVKDYRTVVEYQMDSAVPNVGGSKIAQTEAWAAPSTFRQEATLPAGRVTVYSDGKGGWITSPQGSSGLAGAQRVQAMGDLFRIYYRLLLSDRLDGRTVNAIDDVTVQISDTAGQMANVEFDPGTHLPKRMSYDIQQNGTAPVYGEEVYDDFRDVGGIKVPFKITMNQGGRKFADVVVKDYKINTGLNPLELARRPQ